MENPFKVLGIAPEGLRGLADEEIQKLVRVSSRFFLALYHPDSGNVEGSKKFQEIQRALESLDQEESPEEFAYWKAEHLKPKKEKLASMERALAALGLEKEALEKRFLEFFRVFALGAVALREGEFPVFAIPPCRMLCSNSIASRISSRYEAGPRVRVRTPIRTSSEIVVRGDGIMTRYALEQVRFDPKTESPPELPEGWVSELSGSTQYYWDRKEGEVLRDVSIVGAIPEEDLQRADPDLASFKTLLPGRVTLRHIAEAEAGFPWTSFAPYAALMTPVVRVYSELIGMSHCEDPEDLRFFFLGKPRRIHLLGKKPKKEKQ